MGLLLRVAPLLIWPDVGCVRDECIYLKLAGRMSTGEGMTVASEMRRWLWAPGYPALLSGHDLLLGDPEWIRWTQALLVAPLLFAAFHLVRGLHGRLAGLVAAWCLALSPTLVFFSGRLWSETVYVTALVGGLATLRWSLEGPSARALAPGVLTGLCVLLRGVAAPLVLLFAAVHLLRRRTASAGAVLLGAALTVGPYSAWATTHFGGPVLSDRTLGQMMWLGNNTFEPVSFDHGIGPLSPLEWERVLVTARPHCDGSLDPVAWDDCERANAWAFIREEPALFLRRVPLRWAQWLNPNSFLTRAIRRNEWRTLSPWLAEGLCVTTVLWSFLAVIGGSIGLLSRGKGWFAALTVATVAYHAVAIALVAGLSRYRVPLDVLGLLWAAVWLAQLPGTLGALRGWRGPVLLVLLLTVLPLMTRFLVPGLL